MKNLLYRLVLCLIPVPVLAAGADPGLISALHNGDRVLALDILKQPVDMNHAEADGTTALHWAAHRNDMEIADILIRAGADAGRANAYGVTPLWLACTNANSTMVRKLVDAGANPNAALWTGETVLMECARTGAADGVHALLESGADVKAHENKKGQTALMWAAAGGHSDVTRHLVQYKSDIRAVSAGGFTPLMFAARSGDVATARILIEAGADPNEATPVHGNTLLVASAGGHEELALYLLEVGANPNVADENGITPLHHAARNGLTALNGVRYDAAYRTRPPNMLNLARALLQAGADPNAQIIKNKRLGPDGSPFEMEGATPFLLAAISADSTLMQILEEFEADPGINGAGGITPLMAAARAACTGSCAFQGGNKANRADIELSLQAVRAAVEMGVDVNAKNTEGQTAMHMAAFTGADPVVQYLADQGADVNIKDNYGETPWSMASGISPVLRYRGLYGVHESTAALLIKLGATTSNRDTMDPNAPPPPGQ
jgi:ankyrin repeat protein